MRKMKHSYTKTSSIQNGGVPNASDVIFSWILILTCIMRYCGYETKSIPKGNHLCLIDMLHT